MKPKMKEENKAIKYDAVHDRFIVTDSNNINYIFFSKEKAKKFVKKLKEK